jgi:hypothetical protein
VARVRLEKKMDQKRFENIAIIAGGSLVKTSLKPAQDSAEINQIAGSQLPAQITKTEHTSSPRKKSSAGFFLPREAAKPWQKSYQNS